MANLIQQTPWYRPQPQNPAAFAEVRDIDPVIATYAGVWAGQARTFKAPERRRIDKQHYFGDLTPGPSVLNEPIPPITRWASIVDADVAIRWIPPIYTERSSFKTLERRGIDKRRYFADLTPGPTTIDEPELGWLGYLGSTLFDASTVIAPIFQVPDFIAPPRDKINVRSITEPEFTWAFPVVDNNVAATIIPAFDRLRSYRSADARQIRLIDINEPGFGWAFDVNDDVIATLNISQEFSYRSADRAAINVTGITEPEFTWAYPVVDAALAKIVPLLYGAGYRSGDRITLRIINGPDIQWIITPNSGVTPPALSAGDEVQVLIAGGIECTVFIDSGTAVRVVTDSAKQISVKIEGGTPIKVII